MNLALKYRPRNFQDVVGQKATGVVLQEMIRTNQLDQALLFYGPSGVGKTSMARIVAAALNPETAEDVHNRSHPNVIEIDAASNGSVAAMRELKSSLSYAVPGNRVIIIDEAHSMSPEAFDVFLNMLEHPPKATTFILCTTEAHNLEMAIRHRCDSYRFKMASVSDLLERLSYVNSEEGYDLSDDLLNLIAQRSEGSYRESLMLLKQAAVAGVKTVEDYNELQGEVDYGPTLISSALDGPAAALSQLQSILRYTNPEEISDRGVEILRDIMLLKAGIALEYSGQAKEVRIELAKNIEMSKALKAMTILWDLQTKLSSGDPVRGLEMAFSIIGEVLQIKQEVITPKYAQGGIVSKPTTMSLQQMQAARG